MIIGTVDNVMEAKHLNYPPFRINVCCATKTIPAVEEDATTHYLEFKDVQNILAKTNVYIAGVCERYQSNPQKSASLKRTGKYEP